MVNPWLGIPAADYVGHMSSPEVAQYQVLNRLLREALETAAPRSLLVLGCTLGNGLEHVDPAVTSRVVGVDINPAYLEALAGRFPRPEFALALHCDDLARYPFEHDAFDLVHAALVLEYVEWRLLMPRVVETMRDGGMLSVVLQRPSPVSPAVTRTDFTTLRALEPVFRFVDADVFVADAAALGLQPELRRIVPLASGKALEVLRFRRRPA